MDAGEESAASRGVGAAPEMNRAHSSKAELGPQPALTCSGNWAGSVMPWARSATSIFSYARDRAQTVGRTSGRGDDHLGVGTQVIAQPNHRGVVVVGPAVGDVRAGQEGDAAPAGCGQDGEQPRELDHPGSRA